MTADLPPTVPFTVPLARTAPARRSLDETGLVSFWAARPDPWAAVARRLEDIRGWPDGWDGEGAIAPTPALLNSAADLLVRLQGNGVTPPASITAAPEGSVVIEWRVSGSYLMIEVVAPFRAEWMARTPGAVPRHGAGMTTEVWAFLSLMTTASR